MTPNADSGRAISEGFARRIFVQAMVEDRCAELLEALFDGGSVTVDPVKDKLVIVTAEQLQQMATPSHNDSSGAP